MDNCKNTRFASYNQYNQLLGLATYRREIQSTTNAHISRIQENVNTMIENATKRYDNEMVVNTNTFISTDCQVSFLNPIFPGSYTNPQQFTLPVANTNRVIKNGFHKIIHLVPNSGFVSLVCIGEDGLGGSMVPHENERYNTYYFATPHSNEVIQLIWNEFNGVWTVIDFGGYFRNSQKNEIIQSFVNTEEPVVITGYTDEDLIHNRIDFAIADLPPKFPSQIDRELQSDTLDQTIDIVNTNVETLNPEVSDIIDENLIKFMEKNKLTKEELMKRLNNTGYVGDISSLPTDNIAASEEFKDKLQTAQTTTTDLKANEPEQQEDETKTRNIDNESFFTNDLDPELADDYVLALDEIENN